MFQKITLSILAGSLLFISWPPISHFTFCIFIAFVPLLILETSVAKKELSIYKFFGYIYLAFFIFNVSLTFWIRHAHFSGALFAILCNSLFMTLVFCIYSMLKNSSCWQNTSFMLPILWISFEYLHLNWDLSWPWLTVGNVFGSHPACVQWYSYTGVLGGTLWVFIVNLLFFKLSQCRFNSYLRNRNFFLFLFSLLLPIALSYLVYNKDLNILSSTHIDVMVVQPNIDPYTEKFSLSQTDQTNALLHFISPKLNDSLDFIILPETFLTSPIWAQRIHNNIHIKSFNKLIHEYSDLNIIVGATILDFSKKSPTSKPLLNHQNQFYKVYNSSLQLNDSGVDMYYKSKLVPGAEKMPFQDFLYPILGDKILKIGDSNVVGNFSKQDSVSIFSSSKNHKTAAIVCYESIYGDYVRKFINKGAEGIFIITNDGWWKNTIGYQQHHIYAKLRAIETRRYIARSANTGISSIINIFGEVKSMIDWDQRDIIQYAMPLYNQKTFYVKHGDVIGRICSILAIFILLYFLVSNKLGFSR